MKEIYFGLRLNSTYRSLGLALAWAYFDLGLSSSAASLDICLVFLHALTKSSVT